MSDSWRDSYDDWKADVDEYSADAGPSDEPCDECGRLGGHGAEGCPVEWECVFGARCLAADPMHHRTECFTAEMAATYEDAE
jgi:hypothetical protein